MKACWMPVPVSHAHGAQTAYVWARVQRQLDDLLVDQGHDTLVSPPAVETRRYAG